MSTRTRKPTAERRRQIVEAVLRIIGERGLTALSTTTIAKEVGVTTGALFRHFDSREAIFREVVQQALGQIDETFPDPSLPPLDRLMRLAKNRVRLLGSNPGLAWLLMSEQAYLTLPSDAVEQLRERVVRSRRYLLDALREGIEQGSIRGDIAPEELLVPVVGTIHALVGTQGIHRLAASTRLRKTTRVLSALERLLAPPDSAGDRNAISTPSD